MNIRLILVLVITGITVIFITQNVSVVEVTFLFWSISMSRALLIFFTLSIGFVLGWFLHSYFAYRRSKDEFSNEI
ncbi:MAG: LapA family protein [Proteobacteria bacterium]|nr:LapA family protein [Pseudomonadota bacterium]